MREAVPHSGKAAGQVDKPRSHGIAYIQAGEKIRPTDATGSTHVGGIDMHEFDRRDGNADPLENKRLQRDVIEIVILQAGAALHLTQSPGAAIKAFEHIDP